MRDLVRSPVIRCAAAILTIWAGSPLDAAGQVTRALPGQVDGAGDASGDLTADTVVRLPRPTVPEFDLDPSILIGMTPDDVEMIVGPPRATREQPPATIWMYGSNACVFQVFMYRDVNSNALRALGFTVNGGTPSPEAKRRCFSMVRRPRG